MIGVVVVVVVVILMMIIIVICQVHITITIIIPLTLIKLERRLIPPPLPHSRNPLLTANRLRHPHHTFKPRPTQIILRAEHLTLGGFAALGMETALVGRDGDVDPLARSGDGWVLGGDLAGAWGGVVIGIGGVEISGVGGICRVVGIVRIRVIRVGDVDVTVLEH